LADHIVNAMRFVVVAAAAALILCGHSQLGPLLD
jgi:hypothetical protein